jgi:hypothetical protein
MRRSGIQRCALNGLHPRDLPSRLARSPATVELIENRSDVDVTALARALGESPEAFRWSTMGRTPLWLSRARVVPRPRLCFAWLAAGYHAAMFSIALLDACPIHGTSLVDTCLCGAPFSARLRSQRRLRDGRQLPVWTSTFLYARHLPSSCAAGNRDARLILSPPGWTRCRS